MEIVFYGKVIDKNGLVLEGVDLVFTYEHFSVVPPIFISDSLVKAHTDKNGLFNIKNIMGRKLLLKEIKKEGYWRGERYTFPSFIYTKNYTNIHMPDSNNPVIFELIKEVQDNFLLSWNHIQAPFAKINEPEMYYYNIIKSHCQKQEMEIYDFKCEGSKEDNKFIVSLQGFEASDLIYVSDKNVINENDLGNFKNRVDLEFLKDPTIKKQEKVFRFIFFKSGKLNLYTRVATEICLENERCYLNFKALTNPYGEINFETFDVSKLDHNILWNIDHDFREKIKNNILPKRTDLANYIKGVVIKEDPKHIIIKEEAADINARK